MKPKDGQQRWLEMSLKKMMDLAKWEISDIMADASFRSFARVLAYPTSVHSDPASTKKFILMYFDPAKEDGDRIIATSEFLLANKIRVPALHAHDASLGVVLQEDFGDILLSRNNDTEGPSLSLYKKSLKHLIAIQNLDLADSGFGIYDQQKLIEEIDIFSEYFIKQRLNQIISTDQSVNNGQDGKDDEYDEGHNKNSTIKQIAENIRSGKYLGRLGKVYENLAEEIMLAPKCCTHLDFHSRNLMLLPAATNESYEKDTDISDDMDIGILDYQDMMHGHFCYDVWSLLRDAYVELPLGMRSKIFKDFSKHAQTKFEVSADYVNQQYHLIGVQRCLKVCGIFSRLSLRDGKNQYLSYIPRVFKYLDQAVKELLIASDKEQENWKFLRISDLDFLAELIDDVKPILK